MTKRKIVCFLIVLLCMSLILVSCEEPTEDPIPDTASEAESESLLAESETVSESKETETESETETEEESETLVQAEGCLPDYYPFDPFSDTHALVVRWVDVLGGCTRPDFPKFTRFKDKEFHEFSDMFMVKVEVLDVMDVEGELGSAKEEILALDMIFIPREAAYAIREGEEAWILLSFYYDQVEDMEDKMLVGAAQYSIFEREKPLLYVPIFRYEEGRMIIDEFQLETYSNGRYKMWFLEMAFRANKALRQYGADEKYAFRSGMTMDELEEFCAIARKIPWMVLEDDEP